MRPQVDTRRGGSCIRRRRSSRACGPSAHPGVTPNSILLGGTTPLTGLASGYASVARGAEAYFKYVNAKGGVNGRQITFKYLDDAYNPAQTVQATRQLVEQDKIFADYDSLGTEQNLAIREYLNQREVPQLFVATGARPSAPTTRSTRGRSASSRPTPRRASCTAGTSARRSRRRRSPCSTRTTTTARSCSPDCAAVSAPRQGDRRDAGLRTDRDDVSSQISSLKASGANTLMIFATPTASIQAYVSVNKLGWKPQIFVNVVSSASQLMKISAASSSNATVEGSLSPSSSRTRRTRSGRTTRR